MKSIKALGAKALAFVKKLWAKEPTRVVSATAAVIVFLAAKFGVILPTEGVVAALGFALPLVLGGEIIRTQVSPAVKV